MKHWSKIQAKFAEWVETEPVAEWDTRVISGILELAFFLPLTSDIPWMWSFIASLSSFCSWSPFQRSQPRCDISLVTHRKSKINFKKKPNNAKGVTATKHRTQNTSWYFSYWVIRSPISDFPILCNEEFTFCKGYNILTIQQTASKQWMFSKSFRVSDHLLSCFIANEEITRCTVIWSFLAHIRKGINNYK